MKSYNDLKNFLNNADMTKIHLCDHLGVLIDNKIKDDNLNCHCNRIGIDSIFHQYFLFPRTPLKCLTDLLTY